jgi:NADH dehydrogenase
MKKKRVMVLGAGYGGIFAAANLCKHELFDITIVDKNSRHQLLQQIHFVVSGIKEPEDIAIPVEELFGNQKRNDTLSAIRGTVESIDLLSKTVNIKNGRGNIDALNYDSVIIALGAETQYFGVDGAEEHCLPFRSVQDALKIKQKVEGLAAGSSVVIVGGGPTGVSLAAALIELPAARHNKIKITVIDSSDSLLPGWDERLSATSLSALRVRGIEITTGKRVAKVDRSYVSVDSGEELISDCTVWTAGVKGLGIKTVPDLEKAKSGRLVVDQYSRIPGFKDAFAIGDISAYELADPDGRTTLAPQLAQLAVRQARFVADNIARSEKGEELNGKLSFCQRGHTIALGNKNVGLLSGLLVTGRMCDYAEDTIVDNFVTEIKNKEKGISAKALAASEDVESQVKGLQYPAAFDFVTYATSQGFLDLVR